ncbi:MAG: hypothetical protein UV82_C0001G0059 [Candidatus Magasanikbacteria bacterium GW2011_GWD2_43_18]|uniref:DUF2304 domain-containing protein n=1 Tax=Candidatus Magasanikbacteria bacterium GW2011_GWE2_42_7 TaxID=1619052 RepID=A0A0G1BH77_9BACT|nr:MAG: hypothetical protein UV18_C0001G0022 [Candidatus Magasanikbacteria bacterium GW2011_GWC2_42_27]KKS72564.1 MAG: hypothetical protein UV42_C0007G0016 [Candidatus Magasanikbacteria bacterium GW2011_GWE2_42_7]KKT05270.1 MAG: hypothetical protein UV82_C0001G0059 [Candidatus Magasanikbacteria bacterium GW2011_GWD2_43_18]KKT26108.1 MAG: hypothetical protein UW10_C0001G0022 [Candidatus Magasanikbacteria bacterium GW2011_GWA2_43_9]HBB37606.1 hypothetical protein [Candidatus Magasanikbacteria bac
MIIFQFLFLLFSLFAIGAVIQRKKDSAMSSIGTAFWMVFWILADVVVFLPQSVTVFANHLGIGRGTDLVTYVSFALIFFVLFRLHVKLHEIERDITTIVRKDALKQTISNKQ